MAGPVSTGCLVPGVVDRTSDLPAGGIQRTHRQYFGGHLVTSAQIIPPPRVQVKTYGTPGIVSRVNTPSCPPRTHLAAPHGGSARSFKARALPPATQTRYIGGIRANYLPPAIERMLRENSSSRSEKRANQAAVIEKRKPQTALAMPSFLEITPNGGIRSKTPPKFLQRRRPAANSESSLAVLEKKDLSHVPTSSLYKIITPPGSPPLAAENQSWTTSVPSIEPNSSELSGADVASQQCLIEEVNTVSPVAPQGVLVERPFSSSTTSPGKRETKFVQGKVTPVSMSTRRTLPREKDKTLSGVRDGLETHASGVGRVKRVDSLTNGKIKASKKYSDANLQPPSNRSSRSGAEQSFDSNGLENHVKRASEKHRQDSNVSSPGHHKTREKKLKMVSATEAAFDAERKETSTLIRNASGSPSSHHVSQLDGTQASEDFRSSHKDVAADRAARNQQTVVKRRPLLSETPLQSSSSTGIAAPHRSMPNTLAAPRPAPLPMPVTGQDNETKHDKKPYSRTAHTRIESLQAKHLEDSLSNVNHADFPTRRAVQVESAQKATKTSIAGVLQPNETQSSAQTTRSRTTRRSTRTSVETTNSVNL